MAPGAHFSTEMSSSVIEALKVNGWEPECIHFPKKSLRTSSGCFNLVTSTIKVALLVIPAIGHVEQIRECSIGPSKSFKICSAEYFRGGLS